MPSDEQMEKKIQDKGLNAPRLNPDMIEAAIVGEDYYVFPGTTLTICKLDLANGYHVTGESAAVSLENFDKEIGQQIARDNAKQKIWALEGYLLKQKLSEGHVTAAPKVAEIKDIEFYASMNYDRMEDELHITAKYTDGSKEKIKVTGRIKTGDRLNVHRDYFLAHLMKLQSDEAKEWLEMYGTVEVVE